jgi:hypothetical protein
VVPLCKQNAVLSFPVFFYSVVRVRRLRKDFYLESGNPPYYQNQLDFSLNEQREFIQIRDFFLLLEKAFIV